MAAMVSSAAVGSIKPQKTLEMGMDWNKRFYMEYNAIRVYPDRVAFFVNGGFAGETVSEGACVHDGDRRISESSARRWVSNHCPDHLVKFDEIVSSGPGPKHRKASDKQAESLSWFSEDDAAQWPTGCKVLIRKTILHDDTVSYEADNCHRPDWVRSSSRVGTTREYARME